ncbi:MAG TPA: hypothetical protein VFT43_09005 [Candidatus Polarisedimenticolia bacterium]|nr:hypothetical protein [Candidatus Polarisedimenticolia bacterium]
MNRIYSSFVAVAVNLIVAASVSPAADQGHGAPADGPTIVKLVETPDTFEPASLDLRPGAYIFMVTNRGVNHPVDLMLKTAETEESSDSVSHRIVPNSRLTRRAGNGETSSTRVVELKAGTYTYSSGVGRPQEFTLTVR